MGSAFDPHNVDLATANQRDITCYLASLEGSDNHSIGSSFAVRISSIFVIFVASTATTLFPVYAARLRLGRFHIPVYLHLFFRYFGSGVIIATAFIHLLDPAYEEIGPASCVGLTGGWTSYTWPPAIAMTAAMLVFLLDFAARWVVELKRNAADATEDDPEAAERDSRGAPERQRAGTADEDVADPGTEAQSKLISDPPPTTVAMKRQRQSADGEVESLDGFSLSAAALTGSAAHRAFREQIAAFLVLEFGIIFHSVIIGLNLGVAAADEFATLYPVMVFHQSFEGLGIGARLADIPFPRRGTNRLVPHLPWVLALAYGLTTPVSIAAGMGLRTSYDGGSFTANVVSGIIDSASAGILMYTGFVEMLARDFLFDTSGMIGDGKRVGFMLLCLFLGTALMAMLGKWV